MADWNMTPRWRNAIVILGTVLAVAGVAVLNACETDCEKALRELSQCCASHPPDAGDCAKLNEQVFVDGGYVIPGDAGPDASFDAGMILQVSCESSWRDYANNLVNKGLDPATCTVKP